MADRPSVSLGVLGKYYSARHALGQYRSCGVVATYHVSLSSNTYQRRMFQNDLERSLQATIKQHPGLCYGLDRGEGCSIPGFRQVDEIRREDVVRYDETHDVDAQSFGALEEPPDAVLCRELEMALAMPWSAHKPAWRTVVLYQGISANGAGSAIVAGTPSRVDIAFLAHHAIADGMSGIAFHNALAANFPTASKAGEQPEWPLLLPETKPAPRAIEDTVDLLTSTESCIQGDEGPVWAGRPVSLLSFGDIRSRVRIATIQPENVLSMLQICRQYSITLTGLLHGLICASLTRGLGETPGFRSVTPYSTRRFTLASPTDVVNHISFIVKRIPGSIIKDISGTTPRSHAEYEHVLQIARDFGRDMRAELARFPRGSAIAELCRIQDFEAHCRSQFGKDRRHTYELSNIGVVDGQATPFVGSALGLERLVLVQSAMVAGPAIGLNCASVRNGPLTIAITWQEDIVDESLVEHLMRDLEGRLAVQVFPSGLCPRSNDSTNRSL